MLARAGGKLVQVINRDQREYSEDGVDLTLIDWMLSLTPLERLEYLQRQVNAILAIRRLNER